MAYQFNHSRGEYLSVDGARIYYEETGKSDNPVLLFLHSGGGTIADFNPILSGIPDAYRLIGIDSRGHGRSTRGPEPLTYERLQRDVEAVLAHLNISTLRIIGFSDGGIVGYRLAALTSLNSISLATIGSRGYVRHGDPNKANWLNLTGDSLAEQQPENFETYQRLNPEPDFDRLVKNLVAMWLDPSEAGHPGDRLADITCPVLLTRGDDDVYLSRAAIVENADAVKNSALLNLPFANHPVFRDQKELFMNVLLPFLAKTIKSV